MGIQLKKEPFVETIKVYSTRQLQFAIRLGMLPTPDKLKRILKISGSKRKLSLLAKNFK